MKKATFALIVMFGSAVAGLAQGASNGTDETASLPKADPAAYELLKNSRSSSQDFPANFGGYAADVIYNEDGIVHRGTIDYTPKVALIFTMNTLTDEKRKKVEGDINSLISHRRGGDFAKSDGKHPITFAADDKSPIGRLVCLNDEMKSCYRIRNNQVVQVNRTMGSESFTINILETTPTGNGQFLPRQFTVTYFDPNNVIKRTQAFTDKYESVNGVWLPKMRRVLTTENGVTTVRVTEFENFRLKPAATGVR